MVIYHYCCPFQHIHILYQPRQHYTFLVYLLQLLISPTPTHISCLVYLVFCLNLLFCLSVLFSPLLLFNVGIVFHFQILVKPFLLSLAVAFAVVALILVSIVVLGLVPVPTEFLSCIRNWAIFVFSCCCF